jgi:L-fucose mutarotase
MLKGISSVISPDLLKSLMEMGHGDEIVIADGNFPAASIAQRLVRSDGNGVPELLDAILKLIPLDQYVKLPIALMAVVPGDTFQPTIWNEYKRIVCQIEPRFTDFEYMERFAFYERARKAHTIVASSEKSLYANMILKKGVIKE